MQWLDKFFKLSYYKTSIKKEFLAALTTFLSMSYVIFVNPAILSQAGMPKLALITSTILVSISGTLLIALIPKLPVAIAPGMALNAFFVYTLVLGQNIPWQQALAIVFVSGLFLTILAFFNFQKQIIQYFPEPIKIGSIVGIGLFLTLVGLNNLGLIEPNASTFIHLKALNTKVVIGLIGFVITLVLMIKNIPGSILIGIISATLISCLMGYSPLPNSIVSMPPSISELFLKLDFNGILGLSFIMPIFTLMFVDLFDSLATLSANIESLTFMSETEKQKALDKTFKLDAINSSIGAVLGNSTTTVYLESLSGILQGGKTGLTALFIVFFFVIALFITPLVAIVPSYASASALIIIGIKMAELMKKIDFSSLRFAAPAYITALMMPFTYNISFGIIFGFLSYLCIETFAGDIKKIHWINWLVGFICLVNLITY